MTWKLKAKELRDLRDLLSKIEDAKMAAHEFVTELQEQYQERFDEKSERWQEGDAGEQAQEFLYCLEQLGDDIDMIDITLGDLNPDD